MGRRQSGDRHPEGRAGNIIEPHVVALSDRLRIAAVFAANAALQVRIDGASFFYSDGHQFADSVLVDGGERIVRQDLVFHIIDQKPGLGIIRSFITMMNQRDETVISFKAAAMVRRRFQES